MSAEIKAAADGAGAPGGAESRAAILQRLRAAGAPGAPLPELPLQAQGAQPADLAAWFGRSLEGVGGQLLRVPSAAGLDAAVRALPAFAAAKVWASAVPGVAQGGLDLAATTDPHAVAHLDFFIARAELGVAENGALWLWEEPSWPRSALFLTQSLAIAVEAPALVADLHQAYRRIPVGRRGFGLFLSGPSKTADIEQALVLGAHGARTLTVLLVG